MDTFYNTDHEPGRLPHLDIQQTEHGKAVKAKHNLAKDTVLVNISGPTMNYWETLAMGKKESYCLQVEKDSYIRPAYPFYLFNHSCNPNCGINASLQLITTRDIVSGEELTWDYSTSMLERGWTLNCSCGDPACRKVIRDFDLLPKQLQQYYLDKGIVLPFIRTYIIAKNKS